MGSPVLKWGQKNRIKYSDTLTDIRAFKSVFLTGKQFWQLWQLIRYTRLTNYLLSHFLSSTHLGRFMLGAYAIREVSSSTRHAPFLCLAMKINFHQIQTRTFCDYELLPSRPLRILRVILLLNNRDNPSIRKLHDKL